MVGSIEAWLALYMVLDKCLVSSSDSKPSIESGVWILCLYYTDTIRLFVYCGVGFIIN